MARREKLVFNVLTTASIGVLILFTLLGWYLWHESVLVEENRLDELSQELGQQTEKNIVDARDLLQYLSTIAIEPCSKKHLQLMQEMAVARPYIRAIGYWRAADRQCGTGFIQGLEFTPPRASRIYDSGVIAWWPSKETEIGGIQLFLMRFGNHDIVIDPRLLLNIGPLKEQTAGLWVEGMLMVTIPSNAILPEPESLKLGLTTDETNQYITSHVTLGTIFKIDIIAQQPINAFWQRYLPTLLPAGLLGLALIFLWVFIVFRYSRRHFSLAAEIRNALISDDIIVQYQPIVDMSTGCCVGAEALTRWIKEDGNTVSPEIFVPIVEEGGFATELTIVMLHKVVQEMSPYLKAHPGLSINLNLSAQDLESDQFSKQLTQTLETSGLPASSLKLEITERALINNDAARQRIRDFRKQGHQIAIDDFGTGYSSLSYLESFELDILKIDKSFVDAIEAHAVTSNVISHVIEMAKSLNLSIVAEGVESKYQAEWLKNQHVLLGQGYVYSKPLTAQQLINYHTQHSRQ